MQRNLDSIISGARQKKLEPNEYLYFRGDIGNEFFIIQSGCIHITNFSSNGNEAVTNILHDGQHFGHEAIFNLNLRSSNAKSFRHTSIYCFSSDQLKQSAYLNGALIEDLSQKLFRLYNETIEKNFEQSNFSPKQIIAKRLVELIGIYKTNSLMLDQDELASISNVSRQTVYRNLKDFKSQSLISLGRSKIRILEKQALINLYSKGN